MGEGRSELPVAARGDAAAEAGTSSVGSGYRDLGEELTRLLASVAIRREDVGGAVTIEGDDPVIASPHRLGGAMAVASAAQGAAIAAIWRMRTGRGQDVGVDVGAAGHAVNPSRYLKQNGYPVGFDFTFHEPGNGYFRTRDGRTIYLVSTRPGLRNGLLELLDCANTHEAITSAVAQRDGAELEAAAQSRDLAVVLVRDPDEWRGHPQGRFLAGEPVVALRRVEDGAPRPFGPSVRPLSDLRVLDISHILAGPGLTRTLAEQGADVLRISAPWQTDPVNFMLDTGFGKRSAYLNLDNRDDVARLLGLVADADVVVQSFSPGSLARRGISLEKLVADHPGLVYVSLSCFGETGGPWSRRVGFDHNAQSATGISIVEGGSGPPRLPPTTLVADYITAYLGTLGALAGLIARARDGGSYHVSVSLARTCMWIQDLGYARPRREVGPESEPRTGTMDSAFGRLEYLLPVTRFSETPAFWASSPLPFGASLPLWAKAR